MGKYTVELSDVNGLSCRIRLSLPLFKNETAKGNSTWRVLDEGFLKFRSGSCNIYLPQSGTIERIIGDGNLQLSAGGFSGANLFAFVGPLGGAYDSGEGVVYQPWVLNCEPGKVTWALLE